MRRRLALLAFATGLLGCAAETPAVDPAPPVRLRASIDRPAAAIFDPIALVVRLDYAPGVVPELPEGVPPVEGLTVSAATEDGPELVDGRNVIVRTYALHAEQPGSYIVPAFTVPYVLPDGARGEAATARLFIDVASMLGAGEDDLSALRPLKPPVAIPRDYTAVGLIALGVVLGLALAALVFRQWLRRRAAGTARAAPRQPAHVTALNALAQLERSPLLAQGRVRDYLYGLSDILTAYLEGRFGVQAVASTSEQLLRLLADQPALPGETRALARRFVAEVDPVKFAQVPAAVAQAETWTVRIRRYVETTKPTAELERAA